jgi:hypothetical protein
VARRRGISGIEEMRPVIHAGAVVILLSLMQ